MPVTLKQLAARAQVHPSTISRVANHDPRLRIAPLTRQRIEALLRETEYRPNGVARGLKLRQTLVLAVVIPDITNPFFGALFRGVEDGASPRGYNVLLCNTDGSPQRQQSHLESLHARRVDGVILASSFLKDPTVRWLRQQRIPYVLVNRYSDEAHDPFVGSDDLHGGRIATANVNVSLRLILRQRRRGAAARHRGTPPAQHCSKQPPEAKAVPFRDSRAVAMQERAP